MSGRKIIEGLKEAIAFAKGDFGLLPEAEVDQRIMRGLAGSRGISIAELQMAIEDQQGVRVSIVELYYGMERLVARGEVTKTEGTPGPRGPCYFFARTLRIINPPPHSPA